MTTSINWPFSLPQQPQQRGFSEASIENYSKFPVEMGPEQRRRRTTFVLKRFSAKYILTTDEKYVLDYFHDYETKGGSLSFFMPHPITKDLIKVQFESPPTYTALSFQHYEASVGFILIPYA